MDIRRVLDEARCLLDGCVGRDKYEEDCISEAQGNLEAVIHELDMREVDADIQYMLKYIKESGE